MLPCGHGKFTLHVCNAVQSPKATAIAVLLMNWPACRMPGFPHGCCVHAHEGFHVISPCWLQRPER